MELRELIDALTPRVDAFFGFFEQEPPAAPEVDEDGVAEIDLAGVVGFHIDAREISDMIRDLDATTLRITLDSGGGNVWHGVKIYNILRRHKARVEFHIVGIAASAASVIAMAGDEVVMYPGSMLMVHKGRGFLDGGTSGDARAIASLLDKVDLNMSEIYTAAAGGTSEAWLAVMDEEVWFTGDEAVDVGLADRVETETGTEIADEPDADDDPDAVEASDETELADLATIFGWEFEGRDGAPGPEHAVAVLTDPDADDDPDAGPDAEAFASALFTTPVAASLIPDAEAFAAQLAAALNAPRQIDPSAFAAALTKD